MEKSNLLFSSMTCYFRVDANQNTGLGHIMRCISLAIELQKNGHVCIFVTNCEVDLIFSLLAEHNFKHYKIEHSTPVFNDYINAIEPTDFNDDVIWMILDGYLFDSGYQKQIIDEGLKLLVIDDYAHLTSYWANILLNQNLASKKLDYNLKLKTLLLLGTDYTILRDEFYSVENKSADHSNNILITMGGVDLDNITGKVLDSIIGMADINLKVVLGGSNPHSSKIETALDKSNVNTEVLYDVTNMADLMRWADLAITGAGSTCWELAFLGVPMCTIVLAENQRGIAVALESRGAAINLGWHDHLRKNSILIAIQGLLEDIHKLTKMRLAGKSIIDGKGKYRVVSQMQAYQN